MTCITRNISYSQSLDSSKKAAINSEIQNINKSSGRIKKYFFLNDADGEVELKIFFDQQEKKRKVIFSAFQGGAVDNGGISFTEYFDNHGKIIYLVYNAGCNFERDDTSGNTYFIEDKVAYHCTVKREKEYELFISKNDFIFNARLPIKEFKIPINNYIYTSGYHHSVEDISKHESFLKNFKTDHETMKIFKVFNYSASYRAPRKGEKTFITHNNVIVRKGPGQHFTGIFRMKVLRNIKIIQVSNKEKTIENWGSHKWYKILPLNSGSNKIHGWIFGAFLEPIEQIDN